MASPPACIVSYEPSPCLCSSGKSFLPSPSVTMHTRGLTRGVKILKNYSILSNREQREQGTITFEISKHSLNHNYSNSKVKKSNFTREHEKVCQIQNLKFKLMKPLEKGL